MDTCLPGLGMGDILIFRYHRDMHCNDYCPYPSTQHRSRLEMGDRALHNTKGDRAKIKIRKKKTKKILGAFPCSRAEMAFYRMRTYFCGVQIFAIVTNEPQTAKLILMKICPATVSLPVSDRQPPPGPQKSS